MATFRQVRGPSLADIVRQLDGFSNGRVRQKALGVLARELTAVHRAAFANEASPDGVPWQPLRRARPGKILHRGGGLEKAATSPVFRGNVLAFMLPVYGARQQFGWPGGVGPGQAPTPARPFMALDPLPFALQQRFVRAVNDMIREQLK